MKLTVIRHGKPDEIGSHDPPLTGLGKTQAKSVAKALVKKDFDLVLSSTALRAQETAEPFVNMTGQSLQLNEAFLEIDYGDENYIRVEEARARGDETWEVWRKRLKATIDEPIEAAFVGRVKQAVLELNQTHTGKEVLLFAHGGVINTLTGWATRSNHLWIMLPDYCGISRFGFHKNNIVVKTLNEIAHLEDKTALSAADLAVD